MNNHFNHSKTIEQFEQEVYARVNKNLNKNSVRLRNKLANLTDIKDKL